MIYIAGCVVMYVIGSKEDFGMNNQYETTAVAIRQAEEALKVLHDFTESQYKAKGETMLEQIVDYIKYKLSNADYMCGGCMCRHLALSNLRDCFSFYIYDNSAISSGIPVFSITTNGEVKNVRELKEWMMLVLVKEWEDFKKELDFSIKDTMRMRTKSINDKLAHIGYVNEQLSKWHV